MIKSAGVCVISGEVVFYEDLPVAFVLKGWEEREVWEVLIDIFLVCNRVVDN